MARFYPLFIRRSDGKLEVAVKGKRPEPNKPTDEQLDQTPDKNGVSDFYREIAPDEVKHLDWRRKLGGMLAREMNWKDKAGAENGYILAAFPEGYRLFEHVKKTEKDGQQITKSKNHAAGGNDRQDAYLYGHPIGRKKRFRSPVDFFPHLYWLCTDESGDQDNCACRYCCPDDMADYMPGAKIKAEKSTKPEADPKPPMAAAIPATQATSKPVGAHPINTQAPTPQSAKPPPQAMKPTPDPLSTSAKSKQMISAPLPRPTSSEQAIDRQYNTHIFRPGELVWFKRGQAWGLSVIIQRFVNLSSSSERYIIQPLSHPFQHPLVVTKSSNSELRPWLSWSVPKFTNERLNGLVDPVRYDTADWQSIMQKRFGNGDLEVDGSILAAKAIDATYTLIGFNTSPQSEPGVQESRWNGIFLGAEKIWVGDPVRLFTESGHNVMVIHSIVEQKHGAGPTEIPYLIGDIYTLTTIQHNNPNIPTPNNNPNLPETLTKDMAFRNARTIPAKGTASYWKQVSSMSKIELNQVKGRWYEASLLVPLLSDAFDEMARKGEIVEVSQWLNARNDCVNANRPPNAPMLEKPNIRKQTRREAFGRAVPANTVIVEESNQETTAQNTGTSAGNPVDIDPRFDTIQIAGQQSDAHTDIDDFMNLEDMDEQAQMPGYGQDFGGSTQSQYF
ncbi:Hypothetical protein R9X50_00744300 [Acrodontium crateriforme]|uniref:Uncharacterized protein n=1 Tax=Acrodontium crateriforme TaxID=150365 RepID=A0AAQ3R7P1_9PEZI|nr:Hypothetical protein R9X50_00744300 [Acrodontium crateriforme]